MERDSVLVTRTSLLRVTVELSSVLPSARCRGGVAEAGSRSGRPPVAPEQVSIKKNEYKQALDGCIIMGSYNYQILTFIHGVWPSLLYLDEVCDLVFQLKKICDLEFILGKA